MRLEFGDAPYVYNPGDMTPTKCYQYSPFDFSFFGENFAHKNPLEPGYMLPANCTYTAPPDNPGFGLGLKFNPGTKEWQVVPNYSNIPLFDKFGLSVASPPFGVDISPDLVTEAPIHEEGKWPVWSGSEWKLVEDLSGQSWYDDNGNEGIIKNPWDVPPEGAKIGVSPRRLQEDAEKTKRTLLAEAKDVQEMLQDVVDGILEVDASTDGFEPSEASLKNLKAYKVYRVKLLGVDTTANPVLWPEPPALLIE